MILVIPAIDLLDEHCVRRSGDAFIREDQYFDDPVKMARLWRLQNARTLHVAGHNRGDRCLRTILKRICDAVDIPVQLAGGFESVEDVESAFAAGAYRIVMDVHGSEDVPFFAQMLKAFGSSRIVASLRAMHGVLTTGREESAVDLARSLETTGCRRIVYSDTSPGGVLRTSNVGAMEALGQSLRRTRLTVAGGISGYPDLAGIANIAAAGIDSVVIGRALYENRFPCQQFWCWNYLEELDLSRFTTARLAGERE